MTPDLHLWIIPMLPLVGAAINGFLGKRSSRQTVAAVALLFSGMAFAMVLFVASRFSSLSTPHIEFLATWIRAGKFQVDFSFYLDQLSLVMLLVVTGVGFLIHIYSVGYMWEEGGFYRFFAYLNLFMFFMLTLVLASNYLLMFIGWEGVGLASYLLIGFWFTKDSAASAGKKAFIVNRVGDFGFLIALFLLIKHFGSLNFDQVFQSVIPMSSRNGRSRTAHHRWPVADGWGGGQVGADSALCVATRCHGRPYPGLCADSRRDHGDRGCVYGFAVACHFRASPNGLDGRGHCRHADRIVRRDDWHHADRYQEGAGILHGLAAWDTCLSPAAWGRFPPPFSI